MIENPSDEYIRMVAGTRSMRYVQDDVRLIRKILNLEYLEKLETENRDLKARVAELEAKLAALAKMALEGGKP